MGETVKGVRRFMLVRFTNRGGDPDAKMGIALDGNWVEYEDYAALEQELATARGEEVESLRQYHKLEQERNQLRVTLREHGQHEISCPSLDLPDVYGKRDPCNCGLDAALGGDDE